MAEITYKQRVRVEVGTSTKGVHTYSCTVEVVDEDAIKVLELSDALVAALDKRYPAPEA